MVSTKLVKNRQLRPPSPDFRFSRFGGWGPRNSILTSFWSWLIMLLVQGLHFDNHYSTPHWPSPQVRIFYNHISFFHGESLMHNKQKIIQQLVIGPAFISYMLCKLYQMWCYILEIQRWIKLSLFHGVYILYIHANKWLWYNAINITCKVPWEYNESVCSTMRRIRWLYNRDNI